MKFGDVETWTLLVNGGFEVPAGMSHAEFLEKLIVWLESFGAGFGGATMLEPSNFGSRLRALRRQKYLQQQDLADIAGCSQSYVSRLERGRKPPSFEAVEMLARALEVTPDFLLKEHP